MRCSSCGSEIADGAKFCTSCGCSVAAPQHPTSSGGANPNVNVQIVMQNGVDHGSSGGRKGNQLPLERSDKSMGIYVVLAILLGWIGIHNFYIGRTGPGIAQLLMTVLSGGLLLIPAWIWACIDIFTIQYDADGRKLI